MTEPEAERYLTTGEVAHLFGVNVATVRRWCRESRINTVRLPGKWGISETEVRRIRVEGI